MREPTDDRSPDERMIGSILGAAPLSSSVELDEGRMLALVRGRLGRPPAQRAVTTLAPRRAARLGLAAAAIALSVLFPVALASGLLQPAVSPARVVRTVPMSWAYSYGSIQEIAAASDLVVVGTVARTVGEEQITSGIPETTFALRVERTLKGTAGGNEIRVVQDGGQEAMNHWVEVADFPLMAAGDHVLLFLRAVSLQGAPVWVIVGGPQGRLLVSDGQVKTTSTAFVLPIPGHLTVDQVAAALGSR